MSATFVVLQHVACEPPAAYEDVLRARGHELVRVMVADGEPLPQLDGHAGVIAMGAPMSVCDGGRYDWLAPELEYIAAAVRAGTPYWGSASAPSCSPAPWVPKSCPARRQRSASCRCT